MEMSSRTLFTLGILAAVYTEMDWSIYSILVREEGIGGIQRSTEDEKGEFAALDVVNVLAVMDAWKSEHQKENFIPQRPS